VAQLRRRKLFRMRGGAFALVLVAMVTCVAGTAVSFADKGSEAGAASADVILKKGDRGKAVASVQRKLGLKADGVFGAGTLKAVKRFQRSKGLTADGVVGPQTRQALALRPFARSSVNHGSKGSKVKVPRALAKIAECESGGDPTAVSPDGQYRGKYQFMRSTWKRWGGRGSDPAKAAESHQDRVALKLYRARGADSWPTCGA
jgi:Transglycosylase-like domain/Putative peptidoglycan binding domain